MEASLKAKQKTNSITSMALLGKVVVIMAGLLLMSVSISAFIFLIFGMLPGIAASLIDRRPGKLASKTIGTFNFIGLLPFLFDIWNSGQAAHTTDQLIVDPKVWFLVYSSALFGWLVVWLIPNITSMVFTARSETKVIRLKEDQQKLVDEWGLNYKH